MGGRRQEVAQCSVQFDRLWATQVVRRDLHRREKEHEQLLRMINQVQDVQAAWLLLICCAATRADFLLRTVSLEMTQEYAQHHDDQVQCFREVLHVETLPPVTQRLCR